MITSVYKKFANLSFGLMVVFILSWKLVRILNLGNAEKWVFKVWNLHAWFVLCFSILSSFFLAKIFKQEKISKLDFLHLGFISACGLNFLFNHPLKNHEIFLNFLMPATIYFSLRYYSFKISVDRFYYFLSSVFLIIELITFFDFLTKNYSFFHIFHAFDFLGVFDYDRILKYQEISGKSLNQVYFFCRHTFFWDKIIYRTLGVTGVPHSSAGLLVGFLGFHLSLIFYSWQKDQILRKISLFGFCLTLFLIFNYSVGTAFVSLGILLFIFGLKGWQRLFFFICSIPMGLWLLKRQTFASPEHQVGRILITITDIFRFNNAFIWFGDGQASSLTHVTEVFILSVVFAMGLIAYIFFALIIFKVAQLYRADNSNDKKLRPLVVFITAIVVGSIHYNTTFIFPNNVLLFVFLGIFSAESLKFETRLA